MRKGLAVASLAVVASLGSCATPRNELERVAKDWCMTIRASQVIPVYPLTEDVVPGDVFVVPVPIREQASVYDAKGFLPLDSLLVRLDALDYAAFYADGYWKGTYAGVPHERPFAREDVVRAPRAAFPSYNFSVDKSGGLKLALPLQGVPFGLGFLGAKSARGSVTIKNASTYGIDGEKTYRALVTWLERNEDAYRGLLNIAKQVQDPVYLRVVTRVYLAGGVTVSLSSTSTSGGGADVGAAPELEILDLTTTDPAKAKEATAAYRELLAQMQESFAGEQPGASVRFAQASQRSITMSEDFDRPLVIGYVGFDVKVFKQGGLSAPIPTYATLDEKAFEQWSQQEQEVSEPLVFLEFEQDANTERLEAWLGADRANHGRLTDWLDAAGATELDPSDLIHGAGNAPLRARAVTELGVPEIEE